MMRFAILGVAGYIAPRHLKAVKDTGNQIAAAMDVSDSVGQLDAYSQEIEFFTDFDEFLAYLTSCNQDDATRIDYVSVCSPNHLHAPQSITCLNAGSHVICEKPLVINPEDLDRLAEAEAASGKRVYNVLQLRVHDSIVALKDRVAESNLDRHKVSLTYVTSRGKWYHQSWKGNEAKSGGIAANIGIHFFDMLMWIFGDCQQSIVHVRTESTLQGTLKLDRADVEWKLAIDRNELPAIATDAGKTTYRSIMVDGSEFEFSEGFTDLHTHVYEEILAGRGFGLNEARPSIHLVNELANK